MKVATFVLAAFGSAALLIAQQGVPDAPSATRPANPFPTDAKPAPKAQRPEPEPLPEVPEEAEPNATEPLPLPENLQDLPTFTARVDFVLAPVTVKDEAERPVYGLVRRDFSIYEDGVPQDITYFTSDPFPLSAAVVIDQGMSATAMRKINQTLPAITGAFSQYDEVALFTYGNTVRAASDFRAANDGFTDALQRAKSSGQQGGVPVVSGPMAAGPTVNGRPLDPSSPRVITPSVPSRVLNDAILRAAVELSKRDKSRRRVIFVISDGAEDGSEASYSEVMKVLLSHNISVFALGVDTAALPGYKTLGRVKLPGFGTGNILPKYVSATGGQMFAEISQQSIEQAYGRLTAEARNQYTIGYSAKATPSSSYRSIEVRVKRPNLRVYAKDGYYPLPRPRG